MVEKLRIGVLGLSHDHVWSNVQSLVDRDDVTLVGAAEPRDELRQKFCNEFEIDAIADSESLLSNHELDAVYVFSSNTEGASLAIAAAERGLHVLIEKPMAASLAQADAMLAAARYLTCQRLPIAPSSASRSACWPAGARLFTGVL